MADEPAENLVERIIREQLAEGGMDRLVQAQEAIQKIIREQCERAVGTVSSTLPVPQSSVGPQGRLPGTVECRVPQVSSSVGSETVDAQVEVPTMMAVIRLEPKLTVKVVPAIQEASPELADKIRLSDPQDAMLLLNLFMALMQVVQTLLTVYQITHAEPPTPTQIVQIFNNTTNYVINMPRG